MTKYFPFRILINDEQNPLAARRWCYDNFGFIPIRFLNYKSAKGKMIYTQTRIYDEQNAKWCNRINNHRWNNRAFYFKEAGDAMFFKLLWSGEIGNH